jgi:hypothetical protein
MVLGTRVKLEEGEWSETIDMEVMHFENLGNSLFLKIIAFTPPRVLPYMFSIKLFMPNYTPVTPLPSTTVNSKFELWGADLLNEGYGYLSYYLIGFGQEIAFFYFKVEFSDTNVSLSHRNYIGQVPFAPTPVSLLL